MFHERTVLATTTFKGDIEEKVRSGMEFLLLLGGVRCDVAQRYVEPTNGGLDVCGLSQPETGSCNGRALAENKNNFGTIDERNFV